MTDLALQISQPVHGTGLVGAGMVSLEGSVTGNVTGLFFKWFSSLNAAATASHPELNTGDHSAVALSTRAALAEFGSHVIVLGAADQDGIDLPSIKAVTRSAMAGGAPPQAPAPCVVHRLVAQIRTPASDGQTLSKASATLEFLAPVRWAKETAPGSGIWVADTDYQAINGIALQLHLEPTGPPAPAHTADVALVLASLAFFRADDKTWFRRTGPLPANLDTGSYALTLSATAGGATASASRQVVLTL
jgi:hypothetical protein